MTSPPASRAAIYIAKVTCFILYFDAYHWGTGLNFSKAISAGLSTIGRETIPDFLPRILMVTRMTRILGLIGLKLDARGRSGVSNAHIAESGGKRLRKRKVFGGKSFRTLGLILGCERMIAIPRQR
jgi:hypothetical protein